MYCERGCAVTSMACWRRSCSFCSCSASDRQLEFNMQEDSITSPSEIQPSTWDRGTESSEWDLCSLVSAGQCDPFSACYLLDLALEVSQLQVLLQQRMRVIGNLLQLLLFVLQEALQLLHLRGQPTLHV